MLRNVPLFGVGTQARSLNVSAQDRTNLYVEVQSDPEANGIVLYPTPGKRVFVNFGANPIRGLYQRGDVIYAVNGATLWEVAANGTLTNRGTLNSTGGRVDMTDNGLALFIVDGTDGYTLTFSGNTFAEITDADFVAGETCDFLNGRVLVQQSNSGRFGWSGVYANTWDALDFATAETNPDNLVRVKVDSGILYLFGESTTESWGDSGAEDQPFARIGASAMQWGLAARWSVAKFMGSLACLGKNRLGGVQVYLVAGSSFKPISTPELEQEIAGYSAVSDATGFGYMVNGHPMYQLNFPTANKSWIYDGQSSQWSRVSSGEGRDRGDIQINFLNDSYVSDYESGKLYVLDPDTYTEDGQTIVREVVTRHSKAGDYLHLSQLWVEMEPGVGLTTGQGSDPQLMLQVSRDGGHTYGNEMWRSIGAIGKYKARAVWNRLGRARDFVFKLRVTDPVKTVFVAGWAVYDK
jgi:hypothetical protein